MKYLLIILPLAFFSCKKQEAPSVSLSDFSLTPTGELTFNCSYRLNVKGEPAILEKGVIMTTDAEASFFNFRMVSTSDNSPGMKSMNGSVTDANTVFYLRPYVITSSDTILGAVLPFHSGSLFFEGPGVTDISGRDYSTIYIGHREWMSENLAAEKFANGDAIPQADTPGEVPGTDPVWVNYGFDDQNDAVYGKMYNGYAIMDERNVCPTDWHVANQSDWLDLAQAVGLNDYTGAKMKTPGTAEAGTGLWLHPNGFSTNESGMSVLPGGVGYDYGKGMYTYLARIYENAPEAIFFSFTSKSITPYGPELNRLAYVRCVRD